MSKKEFNLEKLEPIGKLKVKKAEPKLNTENAIESIHQKEPQKEKVKRITIDFPFSLYVDIRKKTVEEEITLKDYFVALATKDIQS